jgi:hypothetical protein
MLLPSSIAGRISRHSPRIDKVIFLMKRYTRYCRIATRASGSCVAMCWPTRRFHTSRRTEKGIMWCHAIPAPAGPQARGAAMSLAVILGFTRLRYPNREPSTRAGSIGRITPGKSAWRKCAGWDRREPASFPRTFLGSMYASTIRQVVRPVAVDPKLLQAIRGLKSREHTTSRLHVRLHYGSGPVRRRLRYSSM